MYDEFLQLLYCIINDHTHRIVMPIATIVTILTLIPTTRAQGRARASYLEYRPRPRAGDGALWPAIMLYKTYNQL